MKHSPLEWLSRRELQVLKLVAEGRTSKEIAALLELSSSSIDTYRHRIMIKLAIENVAGLVKSAIRNGVTQL